MLPTIGLRVDVERSDKEPKRGTARVLDMDDRLIVIDLPFTDYGRHVMLFQPSDSLAITYLLKDGAIYSFSTEVVDSKLNVDNLLAMSIKRPAANQILRIQRREFVRVPVRIELSFMWVAKAPKPPELRTDEGFTWDISGGGLSFYSNHQISMMPNDEITVKLRLPNERSDLPPIKAKGMIVRIRESEETNVSIVSVRFDEITRVFEQRIMQFAFRRQIELKNKGVEKYS